MERSSAFGILSVYEFFALFESLVLLFVLKKVMLEKG
jgi:hypothetical protein